MTVRFLLIVCLILMLFACQNTQTASQDVKYEYVPEYKEEIEIALPQFLPCPEGWNETNFDAGRGHVVPYCAPPEFDPDSTKIIPRAPTPPNFLPCPQGWREVEDETTGLVTCDPYPEGGPVECSGIDKAHFPGESGCVPIGTECPEGEWATNLPSNRRIIYVKAGASAGEDADGSQLTPFGSISEAIAYVGTDAVIALSKGTFDESVVLPHGIVLWGACVSETIVTSSRASENEAVITWHYQNAGIKNLQITGQMFGVLIYGQFATGYLEDVLVQGVHSHGIFVLLGSATVRSIIVRDTKSRQSDGLFGRGLTIQQGASVEVSRAVFTKNTDFGVHASDIGTGLKIQDVLVTDTQNQQFGRGLNIVEGAQVEVSRAVFTQNTEFGIYATGTGSQLKLQNVLVTRTQYRQSDGLFGVGLVIKNGALGEVSRSVFNTNIMYGIWAFGTDSRLTLQDVLVTNTQSQKFGDGLKILEGAKVEVSRAVFHKNRTFGVIATGFNTEVTLQDILVSDTQSRQNDRMYGRGIVAQEGASVEVSRGVFANNRSVGVYASGLNTQLRLWHVLVNNTKSREEDGKAGAGLVIREGAEGEVSQSVFNKNREIGVFAETTAQLKLQDIIVANTLKRECADLNDSRCPREGAGIGIGSYGGAKIEMNQFFISQNAHCGVQLAFNKTYDNKIVGGEIKLSNGIISHNELCGINVQTEDQDLNNLTRNVRYFENSHNNLDTNMLPTPNMGLRE